MNHVVMYSGGIMSWATAMRVAERMSDDDNLVLLFTDTKMEDDDLYRFLHESSRVVGGELVIIADGRTPWEVFEDVRFIGNSQADPCSRILKRDLSKKYIKDHYTPDNVTIYLGYDWTEMHRAERSIKRWKPWRLECPMTERPYLDRDQIMDLLKQYDIKLPRLYEMGFPHNNCGGFCIKAGHAHFRHLLLTMPDRYAYHEEKEEALASELNTEERSVSILRDRTGGTTTPMTLREFRERIEAGGQCDLFDWGGCGCFGEDDEQETQD